METIEEAPIASSQPTDGRHFEPAGTSKRLSAGAEIMSEFVFHGSDDSRTHPTSSIGNIRIAIDGATSDSSDMKTTLKDRVELRLQALRINAFEAARRGGFQRNFVSDILEGKKRSVLGPNLAKLAKALECGPGYLTGDTDNPKIGRQPVVESFDPDAPEPGHEAEHEDLQALVGERGIHNLGQLPKGAVLEADVYAGLGGGGVPAAASVLSQDGNTYAAEGVRAVWVLPDHVMTGLFGVPASRVRALQSAGDSMKPTIQDRDVVFVDVGHRVPSPPGLYALNDVFGGVIVKRLEVSSAKDQDAIKVTVKSDNPLHSDEERMLDEIHIIGRYLGRLTTS